MTRRCRGQEPDGGGEARRRPHPDRLGAAVGTSQAQIARIEKGDADCRISSVERYAAALGFEVRYRLVPASGAQKTGKRAATQKRR